MVRRAAIYARISEDPRDTEAGVQRQLEDCRAYCAQHGLTVVAEYVDNDRSAWKPNAVRPGYDSLLEAMQSGQVSCVVAWHTDRLNRRLRQLLDYIDAALEHNVMTYTLKAGEIDLSTPNGIMMAQIKGAVDEAYVSEARLKNLRARVQIAQNGGRHVQRRPYGWEDGGLVVRESEAAVVREIIDRLCDGSTGTRIASDLNGRGVPTVTGAKWTGIGVKKIALRASNAAIREHLGVEYPGNWQPIVTVEKLDELRRVMSQPRSAYKRSAGRKYLLTGFAVCGNCGNQLSVGAGRSNSKAAYRCDVRKSHTHERTGCGKVSRQVLPLEYLITEAVLYRLDGKSLLEAVNQAHDASDEMKQLLGEASTQRALIDELVEDRASGLLSREQFARAKGTAEAKLEEIERKIQAQSYNRTMSKLDLTKSLRETWETASLEWRRSLLDMLIEKVEVNPQWSVKGRKVVWTEIDGKRYKFDPDLISISWRQ